MPIYEESVNIEVSKERVLYLLTIMDGDGKLVAFIDAQGNFTCLDKIQMIEVLKYTIQLVNALERKINNG